MPKVIGEVRREIHYVAYDAAGARAAEFRTFFKGAGRIAVQDCTHHDNIIDIAEFATEREAVLRTEEEATRFRS